jgi:hypothetical protein
VALLFSRTGPPVTWAVRSRIATGRKAATLAKHLVADAAVKGITVADMNLEGYDIEKYLLEAMTAPIE